MATFPCGVLDGFTGSQPLCSSCFGSGGIELVRLDGGSLWIAYSFLVVSSEKSAVCVHTCECMQLYLAVCLYTCGSQRLALGVVHQRPSPLVFLRHDCSLNQKFNEQACLLGTQCQGSSRHHLPTLGQQVRLYTRLLPRCRWGVDLGPSAHKAGSLQSAHISKILKCLLHMH